MAQEIRKGDVYRWHKNKRKYRVAYIYNSGNAVPSSGPLYLLNAEGGGLWTVQFQVTANAEMLADEFTRQ